MCQCSTPKGLWKTSIVRESAVRALAQLPRIGAWTLVQRPSRGSRALLPQQSFLADSSLGVGPLGLGQLWRKAAVPRSLRRGELLHVSSRRSVFRPTIQTQPEQPRERRSTLSLPVGLSTVRYLLLKVQPERDTRRPDGTKSRPQPERRPSNQRALNSISPESTSTRGLSLADKETAK